MPTVYVLIPSMVYPSNYSIVYKDSTTLNSGRSPLIYLLNLGMVSYMVCEMGQKGIVELEFNKSRTDKKITGDRVWEFFYLRDTQVQPCLQDLENYTTYSFLHSTSFVLHVSPILREDMILLYIRFALA